MVIKSSLRLAEMVFFFDKFLSQATDMPSEESDYPEEEGKQ